jgi:hypothetical protein
MRKLLSVVAGLAVLAMLSVAGNASLVNLSGGRSSSSSSSSSGGGTLPATSGVDVSDGGGWEATATTSIINFATNYTGLATNTFENLWTAAGTTNVGSGYYNDMDRACTYTYVAGGGYYGDGSVRFVPGARHTVDPSRGEHPCGFTAPRVLPAVGDASEVVCGVLVKFGTTYFDEMMTDGIKLSIWTVVGDSGRAIWINDRTTTNALASCDDTACNWSADPIGDFTGNNGAGETPDLDLVLGQWLYIELSADTDYDWPASAEVGRIATKIWSADGTYTGQGTAAYNDGMTPGVEVNEFSMSFINGIIGTPTANANYEVEWVECRVGTTTSLGPPAGFPGSTR